MESIGSKLQHHNKSYRNLNQQTLEEELRISWNRPEISHCDPLVHNSLNFMFGVSKWHFVRKSDVNHLMFYKVSKSVDSV